jgi:uncharacterized protein
MKGCLLDVNLLIALAWPNHVQHAIAQRWFQHERAGGWGTCLVTQLAFVRISSHPAVLHHVSTPEAAQKLLEIVSLPDHSFWPEIPGGYRNEVFSQSRPNILTHAFVTDGYLAALAAFHGGKLATFDRQLARAFNRSVVLVA